MKKIFITLAFLVGLCGAAFAQNAPPFVFQPVVTLPTGACTPAIDTAIRMRVNAGALQYKYCDQYTTQWTDGIPNYDRNPVCTTNNLTFYAANGQAQTCATLGARLSFSGSTLNATPPGSDTQVAFNSSGIFGASAAFTFTSGTNTLALGTASSLAGKILLRNGSNANTTTIQPGVPSSSLTFTWPATLPASAGCLEVNSSGVITQTGSACGAGGGSISGSGTTGKLAKFTGATAISDSILTETTGAVTAAGGYAAAVRTVTTTTTTVLNTDSTILVDAATAGGAVTVTMINVASVPTGRTYVVKKIDTGSNLVTIATTSGQMIDNTLTKTIFMANSGFVLQSDGTEWRIIGNL